MRELDGRGLDSTTAITGTIGFFANVVWACTFGLLLFLSYVAAGILYCITLIGIPFGLQAFKLAGISLWPVGRRVVTAELAQLAREHRAQESFARHRGQTRPTEASKAAIEPTLATPARLPPPPAPEGAKRMAPPQLAPDQGWFVEVVGESNYQDSLEQSAATATSKYEDRPLILVTLEPEDDNPHDPNAVRVDAKRGTVGYLPRQSAREYRNAIGARRSSCSGVIYRGEDEQGEPLMFGIWLNAAWPPRFKAT